MDMSARESLERSPVFFAIAMIFLSEDSSASSTS